MTNSEEKKLLNNGEILQLPEIVRRREKLLRQLNCRPGLYATRFRSPAFKRRLASMSTRLHQLGFFFGPSAVVGIAKT